MMAGRAVLSTRPLHEWDGPWRRRALSETRPLRYKLRPSVMAVSAGTGCPTST